MNKKTIINALIIEDEYPAREILQDYLKNYESINLKAVARSGKEALEKLTNETFDIVFADIHLPDFDSIEILEQLETYPYVIFTTAYDKYAVKAFELGAVDYLLKPISEDRFNKAIERFFTKQETSSINNKISDTAFSFKENKRNYIISYGDIIYFTSTGKKTVIHCKDRDYESSYLIKDLEEKLPEEFFMRIHKQHMINKSFILYYKHDSGGSYNLYLNDEDDTTIPVGRSYLSKLKDFL